MSLRTQQTLGFPALRSRNCTRGKAFHEDTSAAATIEPAVIVTRRELFPVPLPPAQPRLEKQTAHGCHRQTDPEASAAIAARRRRHSLHSKQPQPAGRSSRHNGSGESEREAGCCEQLPCTDAATPTKHCPSASATTPSQRDERLHAPLQSSCHRDGRLVTSPGRSSVHTTAADSPRRQLGTVTTPSKRTCSTGSALADDDEAASPSKLRLLQKHSTSSSSRSGCTPLSPSKLGNMGAAEAVRCGKPVVSSATVASPAKQCKENMPAALASAASPRCPAPGSALLEQLNSSAPRRKLAFGSAVEPKTAEGDDVELLQRAKRSLHTAQPSSMCCRDKEAAEIRAFLTEHVRGCTAGSMYISGAPGTGKTALLRQVLDEFELPCQKLYVNCMSTTSWAQLYERVGEGLLLPTRPHQSPAAAAAKAKASNSSSNSGPSKAKASSSGSNRGPVTASQLQKALSVGSSSGSRLVLVLDEIDQLHSRSQEVLYTIFEWPTLPNSRLVLIGIANALDLTDRLLPRLHARPNCKPKLLHFSPYTKDQIQEIISKRLHESAASGAMDATAIQFCSRRIAAVAGDVRKALDLCRRSIEVLEVERKTRATPSLAAKGAAVSKSVVSLQTMVNLLSDNRCQSADSPGTELPLHQKLAACSLLLLSKHGKLKEATFGKLHDTYSRVCSRRDIGPTDQSEFLNVCTLLEARGILTLKKAKSDCRASKVSLRVDEAELHRSLQDRSLVTSVLSEVLL